VSFGPRKTYRDAVRCTAVTSRQSRPANQRAVRSIDRPPPPHWLRRPPLGLWLSPGPQGSSRPIPVRSCLSTRTCSPAFVSFAGFAACRCRGCLGAVRAVEAARDVSQRSCFPFGVLRTGSQLPPGLPRPDYLRRAQGLTPSPRLHGSPRVPGLFHPGPAHGVPPYRASSLCRAAVPSGARCLPGVCRTSPAPDRSPDDPTTTSAIRSPARCRAGGQAPRAPARTDRAPLASREPSRRSLAGTIPPTLALYAPTGPRCRSPDSVRSAFKALLPAKSSSPRSDVTPAPRPLPSWASPLQGSLARCRRSAFLGRHPLSGFSDRACD